MREQGRHHAKVPAARPATQQIGMMLKMVIQRVDQRQIGLFHRSDDFWKDTEVG